MRYHKNVITINYYRYILNAIIANCLLELFKLYFIIKM